MPKQTSADAVDRTTLPLAEPAFKSVVGKTYLDSKADWPALPKPPEGAPNVVVILLDGGRREKRLDARVQELTSAGTPH